MRQSEAAAPFGLKIYTFKLMESDAFKCQFNVQLNLPKKKEKRRKKERRLPALWINFKTKYFSKIHFKIKRVMTFQIHCK